MNKIPHFDHFPRPGEIYRHVVMWFFCMYASVCIRINRIQYMLCQMFVKCRHTFAHKLKCIYALMKKKSALPASREQRGRQSEQLPPPWSRAVTSFLEVGSASSTNQRRVAPLWQGKWPQIYTVLNFGMTIFNFHFLLLFLANLTSNWVIFDEKMERQA